MMDASENKRTRGFRWIKVDTRRWLSASTRDEMSPAERATWIDLLCMAGENEPPGQVDFTSLRRLANQLNISPKLLRNTLQAAIENNKINIVRFRIDPNTQEKIIDKEINFDQIETKIRISETNRSKIGITLYAILILNWNYYQSEYLRQKTYRRAAKTGGKKLQQNAQDFVTQVTDRGEENRKEEKIGEESRKDKIKEDKSRQNQSSPREKEIDDKWMDRDIALLPEGPEVSKKNLSLVAKKILAVLGSSLSHAETIDLANRICIEEGENAESAFNNLLKQTPDCILNDPEKLKDFITSWLNS